MENDNYGWLSITAKLMAMVFYKMILIKDYNNKTNNNNNFVYQFEEDITK